MNTDGSFVNNLLTTSPFSGTSVTKTALSASLFSYSFTLPTAVTITAGSGYGFSVVNNYTSSPFLWEGSFAGPGTHLNYVVGRAIVLRAPGSLAFSLTSTGSPPPPPPPATVPEPSSWALMIIGFGAAGAALRGRRSRLRPIVA